MVKGISKRVVLIKSPANTLFEEAIFILKEDALDREGVDADRIMKEACTVANNYVHKHCSRKKVTWLPAASLVACGATITGLIWWISTILL